MDHITRIEWQVLRVVRLRKRPTQWLHLSVESISEMAVYRNERRPDQRKQQQAVVTPEQ